MGTAGPHSGSVLPSKDNSLLDLVFESKIPDPTCSTGVVSSDGVVCGPFSCGYVDGQDNCGERAGGEACCTNKVLEIGYSCDVGPPPCVINAEQLLKRLLPCPDSALSPEQQPSFELTTQALKDFVNGTTTDQKSMSFSLDSGAVFIDDSSSGGNSDVVDLSGTTANIILRDSMQPDSTDSGFTICMWFKATVVLDSRGAEYNPLASKWVDGKGWELRVDEQSQVTFVVATTSGPFFHVGINSSQPFRSFLI